MQSTESEEWNHLVNRLSERFSDGDPLELDGILFLIGVQELGQGPKRFKKDEKMALMHIAICRLLEPMGHYEFQGFDQDGWPHYKLVENLPMLKAGEQSLLMKKLILEYFREEGF